MTSATVLNRVSHAGGGRSREDRRCQGAGAADRGRPARAGGGDGNPTSSQAARSAADLPAMPLRVHCVEPERVSRGPDLPESARDTVVAPTVFKTD